MTRASQCMTNTIKRPMKRTFTLMLGLMALLLMATPAAARKYGETLRILAIGNSFSDDGMEHLPALLEEAKELLEKYAGGVDFECNILK